MRADDLTREVGKALEALQWTEKHLTATNEGNAALYCNPKEFYSPLTTQVHEAVLSMQRVITDLETEAAADQASNDGAAKQRAEFGADIAEAFDVPAAMLGPEVEAAYWRRQIERALRDGAREARQCWDRRAWDIKASLSELTDAVMPFVDRLLEQRGRARVATGRAYQLADRWEAAHGSAAFLVRAAGAELRDVLDEAQADGPAPAVVECSAQYTRFSDDRRQCIRAAQHRGDHIDEHGFHWSDTVATYPVVGGRAHCGRASASSCVDPDHACLVCGDRVHEHPGESGCASLPRTGV